MFEDGVRVGIDDAGPERDRGVVQILDRSAVPAHVLVAALEGLSTTAEGAASRNKQVAEAVQRWRALHPEAFAAVERHRELVAARDRLDADSPLPLATWLLACDAMRLTVAELEEGARPSVVGERFAVLSDGRHHLGPVVPVGELGPLRGEE